jgi:hypothetical protein
MKSLRRFRWRPLAAVLIVALAAPVPVWSAVAPLGTARGFGLAKLSVDTGKSWLPIGERSFPILDGAELRSVAGGVVLDLVDGSRVDVFPFSAIRFENSGQPAQAGKILLLYGRVSFRLAERTRIQILTPLARLEPIHPEPIAGEVFVTGSGLMGLKMAAGDLRVIQVGTAAPRTLLASREPVFLPTKPTAKGFFFTSETPRIAPGDVRAIFWPSGRSAGYLTRTYDFVISPGFTADLTGSIPSRLVRVAMAKIPEADAAHDAMPLFDLGGHYVGYVSGPMFYAEDFGRKPEQQPATPDHPQGVQGEAQTQEGKPTGMSRTAVTALSAAGIVGLVAIGAGLGSGGGGGGGGGGGAPPAATPIQP